MQRVMIFPKKTGLFDKWVEYWRVVNFSLIQKQKKLKAIVDLEDKILIKTEIEFVFEALQRREFIELELHESVLREIIKQK